MKLNLKAGVRGADGLGSVPAFGRPTGFIVNYTPDRAVRFDLDGNPGEGEYRLFNG